MTNIDTTTQAPVNPIMAFKGHTQAMAFARKGGAALGALLFSIAKRKEEEGKGPIEMVLFLEQTYSDEEGHNIPEVGSKQGETGNKPYDRYTTEIQTEQGKRKVPGSWFTDAVKSTYTWAELNQRREWCKQGQGEGVPRDILEMGSADRAEEIERINKFIANMRTGLTRGSMLMHQMDAINSMNPERVKATLPIRVQKDADGKPKNVVYGNLIRITDPSGITQKDEIVTVGSFLQYDAAKAMKDPDKGTIVSLKATASKAPKKKVATAGKEYTVPGNVEQVLTLFNVLASGIDQEEDSGEKLYAALLTKASGDGTDAREARISIGKVCLACDSLWTVIRPAYMRDVEAKAKDAVAKVASAA